RNSRYRPALYFPCLVFRDFRSSLLAADQPPHTGEIEYADPQPVPQSVVRYAVCPWPVDHIDIADVETFAPYQCGKKAMQAIEIRQTEEHSATERLQPATGVASTITQDGSTHRICDPRLEFLKSARFAANALARDESNARVARFQCANKRRNECRVVLTVAVERHHNGGPRSRNTGPYSRRLST